MLCCENAAVVGIPFFNFNLCTIHVGLSRVHEYHRVINYSSSYFTITVLETFCFRSPVPLLLVVVSMVIIP